MPDHPVVAGALAALIVASMAACDVEAQGRPEGTFDRTVTVSGPVTLDIRTGSGSIEIHRAPAGGSVHVVARLRGSRSWFDDDVARRIRQIEAAPPVTQEGGMVRIGPMADDRLYRNISISYDVTVPMDTQVQSRSGSGSQTITDVAGPVDVRTGSGSVTVRGIQGNVTALTGSGGITVAMIGEGDLDARAGSGGIEATGARRGVRARTGSGSIRLEGRPAADWDVDTGSGGIRIDFPDDAAFALNVRTGSGSINTTHPLTPAGSVSRNRLTGAVRGGGALVELSTGSGSVGID